jgi:hypothetical protein
MNRFNNVLLVLVASLLLPLAACAASVVSSDPLDGQVLEEGTNKPIPGAIVVIRWQGRVGGPVESSGLCYHVETATTDEQGRFHTNAWKTTEAALGLHPSWFDRIFLGPTIRDREVTKTAYHPGYTFSTKPPEKDTVWLKPFTGTKEERLHSMGQGFGSLWCGSPEDYRKKLEPLTRAMYEEAKSLATTDKDEEMVDGYLTSWETMQFGADEAFRRSDERRLRRWKKEHPQRAIRHEAPSNMMQSIPMTDQKQSEKNK